MLKEFLIMLVFVFIGVSLMSLGLYFGNYKRTHNRVKIAKKKKISVTCSACPSNHTCNTH